MSTEKISPVYFIGHGSPMNAIAKNRYTEKLKTLAPDFASPQKILVISAHWETSSPVIQGQEAPPTIYDFGGFPPALYKVKFPFKTSTFLNEQILNLNPLIKAQATWGWDHGVWSVLTHFIQEPRTEIAQLSLARPFSWAEHIELAQSLRLLRRKGVTIIGSGNIVHNLGALDWHNELGAYEWNTKFDQLIRKALMAGKTALELFPMIQQDPHFKQAVPTDEHFLPFLYCWAMAEPNEIPELFFEEMNMGSLSMSSYKWG